MKKLFNILLAIVLTMVCAFSLTACDLDGSGSNNKTGLIISKDTKGNFIIRDYVYKDGILDNGTLDIGAILTERGITSAKISTGAFDGDDTIKTLIVSDKVVEIEQGAFKNMKSLETLEIPFVGKNAKTDAKFDQTDILEGKSIDKERTFSHFFGSDEYEKGRKMNNGYGDVYVPYSLKSVIVNATANVDYSISGIKEGYAIGYEAFKGAGFLQSISLTGANLKEIGKEAFSGCSELKSITLPSSIKTIYDNAFSDCTKLAEVNFEGTGVELKKNVFSGCTAMNKIDSQINLTIDLSCFSAIGENAFDFGRQVEFNVRNIGSFDLDNIFGTTTYKTILG